MPSATYMLTVSAGRPAHAEFERRLWPLHRARLTYLDQELRQAAGLTAPDGDLTPHASRGASRCGDVEPVTHAF
ncbi:hypothetical protein ACIBF6_02835 [Streptosporangium amethystogenes]|uniref:hypothetical protein n=1 Tax=Streptosporangium amethystogenes TaxID=2002 RepID=UPI0037A8B497